MSARSGLLVLVHGEQRPNLEAIARKLQEDLDVEVRFMTSSHLLVLDGDRPIDVHYQDAPFELEEAQEIAEMYAVERPEKQDIATCNGGFEVVYTPDPEMMVFNTWLRTTEIIAEFTDGKIFGPAGGTFS
jgi:hypothetical protein